MADNNSSSGEVVGAVNAATDALKNAGVGHDAMQGLAIAAAILGLVFLVMWGMKRFGNGKELAPAGHPHGMAGGDLGELKALLNEKFEGVGREFKHVADAFNRLETKFDKHDEDDRERDNRRADQIGDLYGKVATHGEDLATLKAHREQWDPAKPERRARS